MNIVYDEHAVELVECDGARTLLHAEKYQGLRISSLSHLERLVEPCQLFPGTYLGFRIRQWDNPYAVFDIYVECAGRFHRANLVSDKCLSCGLDVVGCSVRDFALYQESSDPAAALEEARKLPFVVCPRCAGGFGQKMLVAYVPSQDLRIEACP